MHHRIRNLYKFLYFQSRLLQHLSSGVLLVIFVLQQPGGEFEDKIVDWRPEVGYQYDLTPSRLVLYDGNHLDSVNVAPTFLGGCPIHGLVAGHDFLPNRIRNVLEPQPISLERNLLPHHFALYLLFHAVVCAVFIINQYMLMNMMKESTNEK